MKNETDIEIIPSETEIIARINELHTEIVSQVSFAKIQATKAIELTVECGRLLIERKKNAGHGKWEEWVNTNCKFNTVTAWRYMRLSQKIAIQDNTSNLSHIKDLTLDSPKTLRQAYIATGILPESIKSESSSGDDSTVSYIRHIDFIISWFNNLTKIKQVEDWSFVERQAVIKDLSPIMEIYKLLITAQKNL